MSKQATPMMQQYRRIRKELPPDTLLFFRLGDFYEMFFDDAIEAASILEIALTKRNNVPMCGVPYHAAENYLARLIKAGKKVAVCDQIQDAAAARGIVERDITRIVTPGAVLGEQVLASKQHNYLAAISYNKPTLGLAMLDLSTGEFWLQESVDPKSVGDDLKRYNPAECLLPEEDQRQDVYQNILNDNPQLMVTSHDDWTFELDNANDFLTRHFGVNSLAGFGCDNSPAGIQAAGAVLHYVTRSLRRDAKHIRQLRLVNTSDYMLLDETTMSNLDIFPARKFHAEAPSLLKVLDTTRTAMGGRLLREWLVRPRIDVATITERHNAVEALGKSSAALQDLRQKLGNMRDLERLIARIGSGGNARDLMAVQTSLSLLPEVKNLVEEYAEQKLRQLARQISLLPDLVNLLEKAIVEEPPIAIKEGGIIKHNYNTALDELREAASTGRRWLAEFQAREQEATGIKSLKVRHNKVFGYYIEVTKANIGNVPEHYVRKQTLVNAERFVTPELKEYENKIIGAQERANALEYDLFQEIRVAVIAETSVIQTTARALAELDVLATFTERASMMNYVRPRLTTDDSLHIHDGRHPIVEQMAESERFVPNDTKLDNRQHQLVIITGPNMAGKSTYIRQVALISIMAQIGSFVPAAEAEICIVDRVFTRVGASDDLARGRSTFMVEMQETANILNNATPRSLIVLDEIGRGTSTFDGISIAWAVAEYLHNNKTVKAKTLFATHYHELTDLALSMPGVQNYNVLVREKNDRIAFLRKIVPGAADKSYGIQVARLAGLPDEVIFRAKEILANLEESELSESGKPQLAKHRSRKNKDAPGQLSLFDT